jgi:hypothetical protein
MRLTQSDRFGGCASRVRSSRLGVRSRSCTEKARLCDWSCRQTLGSLASPEKREIYEIWGPLLQSHRFLTSC